MQLPNDVILVRKDQDWFMVILGFILGETFMTKWWTTYRFPFCHARIAFPTSLTVEKAIIQEGTLQHELIHVEQFRPWWGPPAILLLEVLFPLPFLFSGRWFVERPAYLQDIIAKRRTVDRAVDILWRGYKWPWPRSLMRAWFARKLEART
jgi:hypothetical protein